MSDNPLVGRTCVSKTDSRVEAIIVGVHARHNVHFEAAGGCMREQVKQTIWDLLLLLPGGDLVVVDHQDVRTT